MITRTILIAVALTLAHHGNGGRRTELADSRPRNPTSSTSRRSRPGSEHGWGLVQSARQPDPADRARQETCASSATTASCRRPLQGVPPVCGPRPGRVARRHAEPASSRRIAWCTSRSPSRATAEPVPPWHARKLADSSLENVQVIWRQQPKVDGPNHFGSRIVFRGDGTLFVTTGRPLQPPREGAGPPHDHRQGRAHQCRWHRRRATTRS